MTPVYLGIDLGGSNITAALITSSGKLLRLEKIKTHSHEGVRKTIARVVDLARLVQVAASVPSRQVKAVGIGVPGVISCKSGVVRFSPNLPGWKNVPLAAKIKAALKKPIVMDNDANVAAYGEKWMGAGKKYNHVVVYTLGTGVGGGVIVDSKLLHGYSDGAGELGHMTILPEGPRCNCGNRGCLEALVSGTAIAREGRRAVKEHPKSALARLCEGRADLVTSKLVFQAASAGDVTAKNIVAQTGRFLGIAVANIINLLNPEAVIIGGGVSKAGEDLLKHVRREAGRRSMDDLGKGVKIVAAKLEDRAGVFGAARLAMQNSHYQAEGGRKRRHE